MQETPNDTVTIQEAMKLAGVTRRTIYNWMAKDKVRIIRTAGGGVRIYRATLFRPKDFVAREAQS